jgi:hypothetical protein
MVPIHDPFDDLQSHAGTFAHGLGSEKRLKDHGLFFFGNTRS